MSSSEREQRRVEILAGALQAVDRRRQRHRLGQVAAYTAGAAAILAFAWIMTPVETTLQPTPVARLETSPIEIETAGEERRAATHLEVVSQAAPAEAWLVASRPLRADQVVMTQQLGPHQLVGDEELSGVLVEVGKPGLVRTRGKAFAAFELDPRPPERAPAQPAGSSVAPPRTHV